MLCSVPTALALDTFSRLHSLSTKDLDTQYCDLCRMSYIQSAILSTSDNFFVFESAFHIQQARLSYSKSVHWKLLSKDFPFPFKYPA